MKKITPLPANSIITLQDLEELGFVRVDLHLRYSERFVLKVGVHEVEFAIVTIGHFVMHIVSLIPQNENARVLYNSTHSGFVTRSGLEMLLTRLKD